MADDGAPPEIAAMSFEAALAELERIVRQHCRSDLVTDGRLG